LPKVAIIIGSKSDFPYIKECEEILKFFNIDYEINVISAHRNLDKLRDYLKNIEEKGVEVIIAGAGYSAHLPGVVASIVKLPVIGIPFDSSPLLGIDALFSIVQMPKGVPVATMGIGKAGVFNAIVFAARILSLKYKEIENKLEEFRKKLGS